MTMVATVIRKKRDDGGTVVPEGGHFEEDPVTGDIIWVADVDGPEVIDTDGNVIEFDVPCIARAFTDTGYRSASNTEEFEKGIYRVYEYVELRFPPQYIITRQDVVTAIRDARTGKALWLEEEALQIIDEQNNTILVYPATDFDVMGVNPILDPFGDHIENMTVLKRAAVQSAKD